MARSRISPSVRSGRRSGRSACAPGRRRRRHLRGGRNPRRPRVYSRPLSSRSLRTVRRDFRPSDARPCHSGIGPTTVSDADPCKIRTCPPGLFFHIVEPAPPPPRGRQTALSGRCRIGGIHRLHFSSGIRDSLPSGFSPAAPSAVADAARSSRQGSARRSWGRRPRRSW